MILVAVLTVLGSAMMALVMHLSRSSTEDDLMSQAVLPRLELGATPDELQALFGPALKSAPGKYTVDFRAPSDPVRRLELDQGSAADLPLSKVTLFFKTFDHAGVTARIKELAPHRLHEQNASTSRVSIGDAVLDIAPTYISLWHWSSSHAAEADYARCAERLAAYWALVRFAVLNGDKPTPQQLKLINGPTLRDVASLDGGMTVEQASSGFHRQVPTSWCRSQAGLRCVTGVDDALIDELSWEWPNGLRARPQRAHLTIHKARQSAAVQRHVAGCLTPLLGEGEEQIVDYVKDTRYFTWKDRSGDSIILDQQGLTLLTGSPAPVDRPGAWVAQFPKLMVTLEGCSP